ncbi:MAG TPA: hypothetical protein LFW21_02075 [Rickettsia endosymbiont of Pyrocoelia pectoralis]|nr:hypothetical protein [Rickettsia endosymbiont of Pyrocoelia pectoralis]
MQNPAPDTSHEAGVFNSAGIRVMQVKDITVFEKLLESKQPVVIDPQHSKIYGIPLDVISASPNVIPAEAGIQSVEQRLYDTGILADGIYASPLTSYVTAIKHEFTAEGVRAVPVATEGVLKDKKLGALLAEAKAGDTKATEQLLSVAYEMMSFKGLDSRLRGNDTEGAGNDISNVEKLRINLETLTAPKIGQNNDELKAVLGYNMRLIADSYKKGIISEDLFKQAIISGTEVGILLDKMTTQKEELSKEQKDKVFLEYFHSEKKFAGLMLGEGNSIATSLKAKQYELPAETLNPEIKGDAKIYLVESLKLRDYLISDEQRQNWDKFCGKICANPENAKVLASIISKAASFNAHEQWINYIFADVNDPGNPQATLAKLVKDFNEVDLNKIQNATNLIKSMESQIPEWSDPAKFPKLYKELQSNIATINENLKWNPDATNLEKVLILEQVNRLTDVMDKSCKSLERSGQYPESMKDAKGNDLQTVRFKDMVTQFYGVMEVWVGNGDFRPEILNDHLSELKRKLDNKETTKESGLLNKKEFNLSDDFAASRAVIDFTGNERSTPKTLEDLFTLIHQDTIRGINNLNKDLASKLNKQYPSLVKALNKAFDTKIKTSEEDFNNINEKDNNKTIENITTTNEIKYPLFKTIKNIPLRGHANVAEIKYNIKDKTTTVNFSLLGDNDGERNRLEYISMNHHLELMAMGCAFISPPYLDKEKGIVNFEVKIDNEKQVDKLIDVINNSIEISYNLGGVMSREHERDYNTDWLESRIKLLDELNKQKPELTGELNNLKLFPNIDFTYKQFQAQDSKAKEFFINNAYDIRNAHKIGFTTQLIEIYNKDNDIGELLAKQMSKDIYSLEWLKNTIKLLDELNEEKPELQKELGDFKLFHNADFVYKDLPQHGSKEREFFVENISGVKNFLVIGITPHQVLELYNKDNNLGELLIKLMSERRTSIPLRNAKLTFEDLKKCNLADIQNLVKGTVTAQKLKTSLVEKAPVGKWTAKVQEGRQTISQENKGSQR